MLINELEDDESVLYPACMQNKNASKEQACVAVVFIECEGAQDLIALIAAFALLICRTIGDCRLAAGLGMVGYNVHGGGEERMGAVSK
eukprot:602080-Pelagomonas_calceolata.AAC.1